MMGRAQAVTRKPDELSTMQQLRIISAMLIAAAFLVFSISSANAAGTYDPPKASKSANLHPSFVTAQKLIGAQDYSQALTALSLVIKDEPQNADAWNLKGFSHRKIGEFSASQSAYETALSLDPKHTRAMEYMGELYLTLGNLPEAEALLKRLNKLCYFNCKDRDLLKEAIAAYRKENGIEG